MSDEPFAPLPTLEQAMLRELEAAALHANGRYLLEVIEEHSFCPFSRGGRAQGQTARFVQYAATTDMAPLVELMVKVASDASLVVAQVIFPLVEVSAEAWGRFCHELTALGNKRLLQETGKEVFAVAPLHPSLSYKTTNPFALIPLFRRAPDPTIQWVRLDGLEAIYEGRTGDTTFVDTRDIMMFMAKKHRPPLFERIAKTNMQMANHLGIDRVENALAEISRTAHKRYTNILLGGGGTQAASSQSKELRPGCPHATHTPEKPLLAKQDGEHWDLGGVRGFAQRTPRHVRAGDVDLVVIRMGNEVRVFYGRCPHRLALLSDAMIETDRLVCRQHGWDFRLDDGLSEGVPGESVHRFSVQIGDGRVQIAAEEIEQWRAANPQAFELSELIP